MNSIVQLVCALHGAISSSNNITLFTILSDARYGFGTKRRICGPA